MYGVLSLYHYNIKRLLLILVFKVKIIMAMPYDSSFYYNQTKTSYSYIFTSPKIKFTYIHKGLTFTMP